MYYRERERCVFVNYLRLFRPGSPTLMKFISLITSNPAKLPLLAEK